MRIEKLTITPQDAAKMLENNLANRALRKTTVEMYAKQMRNGEWQLNGESIKFNSSGILKDGQHRLNACVAANVPFETYVIYDDDSTVFDVGVKRTVADLLKLENSNSLVANNTIIAAVKLHLERLKTNMPTLDLHNTGNHVKITPTVSELISYAEGNSINLSMAFEIVSKGRHVPLSKKSACVLACYYALRSGIECESLKNFFTVINTGFSNGAEESSAIVIRNNLLSKRLKSGAIETTKQVCYAIKDFINKIPRSTLYRTIDKDAPYFDFEEMTWLENLN